MKVNGPLQHTAVALESGYVFDLRCIVESAGCVAGRSKGRGQSAEPAVAVRLVIRVEGHAELGNDEVGGLGIGSAVVVQVAGAIRDEWKVRALTRDCTL